MIPLFSLLLTEMNNCIPTWSFNFKSPKNFNFQRITVDWNSGFYFMTETSKIFKTYASHKPRLTPWLYFPLNTALTGGATRVSPLRPLENISMSHAPITYTPHCTDTGTDCTGLHIDTIRNCRCYNSDWDPSCKRWSSQPILYDYWFGAKWQILLLSCEVVFQSPPSLSEITQIIS